MAIEKLSYKTYDSTNTESPFLDSSYTNPSSENDTRKQLGYPLVEVKNKVNEIVDTTNANNTSLTPKFYTVQGKLGNGGGLSLYGFCTAIIIGKLAIINFNSMVVSVDTTKTGTYGINRDLLVNLGIPNITPKDGGIIEYIENGTAKYGTFSTVSDYIAEINGGGMSAIAKSQYWAFNRLHNKSGGHSSWSAEAFKQYSFIRGTIYGVVS